MRLAKETHKFLIAGVCVESAKKMKFFFSPYLTEEYPIWWGEAPHIMYNLVEQVSLEGKTIVPFCTSISSGIGSSAKSLKVNAKISSKTIWLKGRNFYNKPSQKTVDKWVEKLNY